MEPNTLPTETPDAVNEGVLISDLPQSAQRLLKSSGTFRVSPNKPIAGNDPRVINGRFVDAVGVASQLHKATGIHAHVEDTRTTKVLFDTARNLPPKLARRHMAVPIQ